MVIEEEILINAPLDKVWKTFTDLYLLGGLELSVKGCIN